MNLTKEQAAALGEKVLKDIGFWGTDIELPAKVTLLKEGLFAPEITGPPEWLVSFDYRVLDIVGHPGESVHVSIKDADGIAYEISQRHGTTKLGYDAGADKYFKVLG